MLETFLEKSAWTIFNKYPDVKSLENLCIIVPTQRAGYFFKRALAQCSNRPFLAPEVIAIDDFVAQRCGVEISDIRFVRFPISDWIEDFRFREEN